MPFPPGHLSRYDGAKWDEEAKMATSVEAELKHLAGVDLFKEGRDVGMFVGHPFHFDYATVKLVANDKWKNLVGGIPAGAFLLCAYNAEEGVDEMILVRVIKPTALPTDSEVIASMVEYYKEDVPANGKAAKLDSFTRYEFMFSGLECRVLGTFYRDAEGETLFGADVENFYSAHNYSVYKPTGRVLEYIVNFREGEGIPGGKDQVRLGEVRYSASQRMDSGDPAPIYVSALDFVGKRTALFGMTRTGKSNTVKKILESTVDLSKRKVEMEGQLLKPVGQIIFDVNGEYANANQQDEGTAIFELYEEETTRYSLLEKTGFEIMKINFHRDLSAGLGLLQSFLKETSDYVGSFLSISLEAPDEDDRGDRIRYDRLVAAYRCVLAAAGFQSTSKVRFQGQKDLNDLAGGLDPTKGLALQEATTWFSAVWDSYDYHDYFSTYKRTKGREWADEDLKATLAMLTRKTKPGGRANVSGYRKLRRFSQYHTAATESSFEADIVEKLRHGEIVIIDLSQGDPEVQATYSERICIRIFGDAMQHFIDNEPANYIQLYFEEAHNLFPKKEDPDLTQIYNRIAKEGAKMRLGLVYATQEPSSISANVLKNTQNWFVSHLNNQDELREVKKYYDFEDFTESLQRTSDRGFIRMKTYSNSFIVPVQIDRFLAAKKA
jgi:DNA helicase HerA-like ATPase